MEVNVEIGLGLVAAGVVGYLVWLPVARMRLGRHQRVRHAGPSTMELRAEPPAVVNHLVNELRVTEDALGATILDLAARDHLDIIELSPTENLVVPHRRAGDALTPYDDQVLRVVEAAAGAGPHATVPAIAAALGPGSADSWLRFATEVRGDARRRGLVSGSASSRSTGVLMGLSVLPCAGLVVAVPPLWLLTPFLFVGLLLAGIFSLVIGHGTQLTAAGSEAASHWLGVRRFIEDHGSFGDLPPGAVEVWDRYLAYGAAMGLSETAVHGLVTELRTTVSAGDVGRIAGAIGQVVRATRDPERMRAWRIEQHKALFGADTDPDLLFGPDEGDFWQLLDTAARGYRLAAMAARAEPDLWRAAAGRRIDALVAAAPSELAADAARVAPAARRLVEILAVGDDSAEHDRAAQAAPVVTDLAVRPALDRLVAAVAAHRGVEATPEVVLSSMLGGPPPVH